MKNIFFFIVLSMPSLQCITFKDLQSLTKIPTTKLREIIQKIDRWARMERQYSYHKVLPALINKHNLKIGCEIGVSCGFHSHNILALTKIDLLYSIDPYIKYPDPTNDIGKTLHFKSDQDFYDVFYLTVKDRLSIFGNRSNIIRDFSLNAATKFKDQAVDFIFLDANHTYQAVLEDLEIWYSKLKSGGIFCGDDYCTKWPGVPKAVNEFFSGKKITVHTMGGYFSKTSSDQRLWWIVKP